MNRGVFSQAENRLSASRKKAHSLRFARSALEAKELWSEFLTEHQRTFNRLGNAMDTPAEQGWFDRLVALRKNDPLLNYLQQARHADEHGRQEIIDVVPGFVGIGKGMLHIDRAVRTSKGLFIEGWEGEPGGPISVGFTPASVRLPPVTNRGATYPVPEYHLGNPIKEPTPAYFADSANALLGERFAEARRLFS